MTYLSGMQLLHSSFSCSHDRGPFTSWHCQEGTVQPASLVLYLTQLQAVLIPNLQTRTAAIKPSDGGSAALMTYTSEGKPGTAAEAGAASKLAKPRK